MITFSFAFDEKEIVSMRNGTSRMIVTRALSHLAATEDREALERGVTFNDIAFEEMSREQRVRVAEAVLAGTRQLRNEVARGAAVEEEVLPGITEKLDELIELLLRHVDS